MEALHDVQAVHPSRQLQAGCAHNVNIAKCQGYDNIVATSLPIYCSAHLPHTCNCDANY